MSGECDFVLISFSPLGQATINLPCVPHERVRKNVKSILELNVIAGTIKFQFYLSVSLENLPTSVLDVGSTSCEHVDSTKGHEIQFDGCSVNLIFFLYCFCRYVQIDVLIRSIVALNLASINKYLKRRIFHM